MVRKTIFRDLFLSGWWGQGEAFGFQYLGKQYKLSPECFAPTVGKN